MLFPYLCIMAVNDDELERRAVEELLKEASRGRVRAETMGPAGWMKCPLGSTNKRFLLNTLRPCAAERRSGSRSDAVGRTEDGGEKGDREPRHRPEDREYAPRRNPKHRRAHPPSHSQSSRPSDSSTSELASTGHAPHHTNQSNRTRSRSPIRERLTTKKSTDRT